MVRDRTGRFVKGHPNIGGKKKGSVHTFTNFKNIIIAKLEADPKMANDIADYYLHNPRMKELLWKMIDGMPQGSAPNIPIDNAIIIPILGGVSVKRIEVKESEGGDAKKEI